MKQFADLVFKEYEREVLELLLDRPDYGFTVKELADDVSASYNSVKQFLERLNEFGIVKFTSKGNYRIVEYNADEYHEALKMIFMVEGDSRVDTAHEYAEELYSDFEDKINSICLFGSVARGVADKDSDIDILVLVEDNEDKVLIEDEARELSLADQFNRIVAVVETFEEFRNNYVHGRRFEENVFEDAIKLEGVDIREKIS